MKGEPEVGVPEEESTTEGESGASKKAMKEVQKAGFFPWDKPLQ